MKKPHHAKTAVIQCQLGTYLCKYVVKLVKWENLFMKVYFLTKLFWTLEINDFCHVFDFKIFVSIDFSSFEQLDTLWPEFILLSKNMKLVVILNFYVKYKISLMFLGENLKNPAIVDSQTFLLICPRFSVKFV